MKNKGKDRGLAKEGGRGDMRKGDDTGWVGGVSEGGISCCGRRRRGGGNERNR